MTQLPQAVEIGNSEEITRNDCVTTHTLAVDYGHSEEILKSGSVTTLPPAVENGHPEEIPKNDNVTEHNFKVLSLNVCGITYNGRLEQIRNILIKHDISVAILSETETNHSIAATTNIEGFKAFCPPNSVIGPLNKEVGVIMMISNKLSSDSKPRPDINGGDSIQTVWIELVKQNLMIGGVYRRARASADLEKAEFDQLSHQVLKAASTGKKVLLLGDINVDHLNPNHKKAKEAKDLLSNFEAASLRRLPNSIPTWKSFGLHKVCKCSTHPQQAHQSYQSSDKSYAACGCPKSHLTSVIDNC